jgi:hypothetical protein
MIEETFVSRSKLSEPWVFLILTFGISWLFWVAVTIVLGPKTLTRGQESLDTLQKVATE